MDLLFVGVCGTLYGHSKILNKSFQIFRHSLFCQKMISKPFRYFAKKMISKLFIYIELMLLVPLGPFLDIRKFWPKFFEFLDIHYFAKKKKKKKSQNHLSISNSCCRGPVLDIRKFRPNFFRIFRHSLFCQKSI